MHHLKRVGGEMKEVVSWMGLKFERKEGYLGQVQTKRGLRRCLRKQSNSRLSPSRSEYCTGAMWGIYSGLRCFAAFSARTRSGLRIIYTAVCHQLPVTLHSTKYLRQIPPDLSTQTSIASHSYILPTLHCTLQHSITIPARSV